MDEAVSLGGTEWTLVELGGASVDFAEGEPAPFLVLDLEESQVTGSGGCNRLVGSFTLSEDELRFGPLASTRMACADAVMEREPDVPLGARARLDVRARRAVAHSARR